MRLQEFLERLQSVRHNATGWMARCPAHADNNPSLSVTEKGGKILLKCFAGCSLNAIMAALHMDAKELFQDASQRKQKLKIVATYDYTDESGNIVYQNVRYQPKDFRLRRPNGKGRWVWSVESSRRTIYNLPAVITSRDVLWTEGEKDADTAKLLGFTATTAGSSESWQDRFAVYFTGKRLVIIADSDAPGRKHARQLARTLCGKTESLKVIELPGAKDLTEWIEGAGTRDVLLSLIKNAPEWKPETTDGADLLIAVYRFVRRFVSLAEPQAVIIALWVAHTHCIDAAKATPYLAVTSAEKESGKTRLLEVLETIAAEPWLTGRVTAAVLVRKVDDKRPTLLLDESDAAFGGEKDYAEALRGILNTGHRRSGVASLCVGKGAQMSYRDFSTFCPKAIAGIGKLPDTVAGRSIPIRLKRAAPGEAIERFRPADVRPEADVLRARLEQWAESIVGVLRGARPPLPEELSDRQQDGAEPLLAIADVAGKSWREIARKAVVELCAEARHSDDSIGVRLLRDIRQVFESRNVDKISSVELAEALVSIETSPWAEWNHGKPLTAPRLARQLRPFEVTPHTIRVGDTTFKGYELADFEDSFKRYLRALSFSPEVKPSHRSQPNTDAGNCDTFKSSQSPNVTLATCEIGNVHAACDRVTVLALTGAGPIGGT